MHPVQRSIFRSALAGMLMLGAAPVLAQSSEEPSTRAGLMQTARETLATQSVKPQRSAMERGLSWYDNQHVLDKIFGGWKGIRFGGGDFPAGAGMKFGVAFDKPLTTADPDPTTPNNVDFRRPWRVQHTRVRPREHRHQRAQPGRPSARRMRSASTTSSPRKTTSALGWTASSPTAPTTSLMPVKAVWTVHWRPCKLDFGGGVSYFSPRVGSGTDSRFRLYRGSLQPGNRPGSRNGDRLHQGPDVRRLRLA